MKTVITALIILISFDCSAEITAREHAQQQVRKMLNDRPMMARFLTLKNETIYINKESMPYKYAIDFYSKKINHEFIYWSPENLKHSSWIRADHVIPRTGKPGKIRLRKSFNIKGNKRDLTSDELWASFIFETNNIENAIYFLKYKQDAIKGKLNRDKYIALNQELEYFALIKKKNIYINQWLPWAKNNNIKTHFSYTMNIPPTFDQWIKKRKTNKAQPYVYWENYYDKVLDPYIKKININRTP